MDVLSFTTIILLLIIIVGTYLIFTNQIEGKMKIIIIIAVLLCFIYFIINIIIIKTTSPVDASIITYVPEIVTTTPAVVTTIPLNNETVPNDETVANDETVPINETVPLIDETSTLTVETAPLIDTTSPTFSLSTWIYINDWKPGVTKTIFSMTNDISYYTPKINLDSNKNELVITYYTKPSMNDNSNLDSLYTIQAALKRYKDAKKAYILASNKEKDIISPSSPELTEQALTELIAARANYDGGKTGSTFSQGSNIYQTIYVPSSRSQYTFRSAYIGECASNSDSIYSNLVINLSTIDMTTQLYIDTSNVFSLTFPVITQTPATNTIYKYDDFINIATGINYNTNNLNPIYYITNILNNYPNYATSALYTYVNNNIENSQAMWITGNLNEDYSLETIIIPQIRIQKWINIVINFGDNSVDSYLDGKLVDTRISTGSKQYVTTIPNNTRLNWGGFTGYISSYKYKPKILSPQNVLKMYNKGR
jgi:hypothetical protein